MDEKQGKLVEGPAAEGRRRGVQAASPGTASVGNGGADAGGEGAVEAAAEPALPVGAHLRRKLLAIIADVHRVQKRGRNTAQNYKFVQESDLAEAVRPLLVKHGVTLMPLDFDVVERRERETRSGAKETLTRIVGRYEIFDVESGEHQVVTVPGEGADTGDKGPYKAMTGSGKYLLLKLFWIPTGDEPEADPKTDERQKAPDPPPVDSTTPITRQMQVRLGAVAKAAGHEPAVVTEWLAREHGCETSADITFGSYDVIMRRLASKEPLPTSA